MGKGIFSKILRLTNAPSTISGMTESKKRQARRQPLFRLVVFVLFILYIFVHITPVLG